MSTNVELHWDGQSGVARNDTLITLLGSKPSLSFQFDTLTYKRSWKALKVLGGVKTTLSVSEAAEVESYAIATAKGDPLGGMLSTSLLKVNNLSDVPNKSQARMNLGLSNGAVGSDDNALPNPSGQAVDWNISTVSTNGGWVADFWRLGGVASITNFTASRIYDVAQSVHKTLSYLTLACTSAPTLSNGMAPNLAIQIPMNRILSFFGTTFTVSFWMSTTKAGKYSVALRSRAAQLSYVHSFDLVVGWNKVSFTVNGGLPTGNMTDPAYWGSTESLAMTMAFVGGFCGTDLVPPTLDSWVAGNFFGASAQAGNTSMWAVGDSIKVTAAKMELGDAATDYKLRPPEVERMASAVYYEEVYMMLQGATSSGSSITWSAPVTFSRKAIVPTVTVAAGGSLNNVAAVEFVDITQYKARMRYTWTTGNSVYTIGHTAIVDARSALS